MLYLIPVMSHPRASQTYLPASQNLTLQAQVTDALGASAIAYR